MLIILSPAKNMDLETALPVSKNSQPQFLTEAAGLVNQVKQLSLTELQAKFKVSEKLALLNYERFQSWQPEHSADNSRPAIFTFKGDAYLGLDAFNFSAAECDFAQSCLRILSGLYGVLKPLDLIQPYRLEMGGKFIPDGEKNLYSFWQDKITKNLNLEKSELLINLASTEYASAVDFNQIYVEIITPQFLDQKSGKYKIISSFAKKARGMMAKWMIKNQIDSVEKIKGFSESGYQYCPERSTEKHPVFIR